MKAITYNQYGGPEVLKLKEFSRPTIQKNEVLIEVRAASVNPLDWHMMRGTPYLVRASSGLFKPKSGKLGADISGVVIEIGDEVQRFRPGDEVFGEIGDSGLGSLAELTCAREQDLVLKPKNLSFQEAAAVPIAALTAFQGLKQGNVQAGNRLLINGASGGVGTFAVQIAKSLGAEITAVCSGRNTDLVKSLGAHQTIDYTQQDFCDLATNGHYDRIFDLVGNRTISEYREILKPGGICMIAGFTSLKLLISHLFQGAIKSTFSNKKTGLMKVAEMSVQDLESISALIMDQKVKPVIDRTYPLIDTAQAIEYLEEGHARGKVVISVA